MQAHLSGLGVLRLSIEEGRAHVVTAEQEHLRGNNLLSFHMPLSPRVVSFLERDIEVRYAGPLAQMRRWEEIAERDPEGADPVGADLRLFSGGKDEHWASYEASRLQPVLLFKLTEYLATVRRNVWQDLILCPPRWQAILRLADELERRTDLDGKEAAAIIDLPVLG